MRRSVLTWTAAAAAGAGALAAYALAIRPWHLSWGATPDEARESFPGDELVASPESEATHAITIEAPVNEVWPWLVQIGQDKGGFYSYTWLENLFGCHMRNAGRIMPEYQQLRAGDTVRLHPKVPPLPVLICEPPKTLVMGSNTQNPGTWGFYLRAVDEGTTRLIVRGRGALEEGPAGWLFNRLVFEPAHFIMERKMLLSIKRRAESVRRYVEGSAARHLQVVGEQW